MPRARQTRAGANPEIRLRVPQELHDRLYSAFPSPGEHSGKHTPLSAWLVEVVTKALDEHQSTTADPPPAPAKRKRGRPPGS